MTFEAPHSFLHMQLSHDVLRELFLHDAFYLFVYMFFGFGLRIYFSIRYVLAEETAEEDDHNCQVYLDECAQMRCPYGMEAFVDETECNRCRCIEPCSGVECPEGSQCGIDINRNRTSNYDPNFIAVCREGNENFLQIIS